MEVTLYKFNKRINSTKIVNVSGIVKQVSLKGATSTLKPTFIFSGSFDFNLNYLKFNGNYYFIEEVVLIKNELYELNCEMDYLASYKSEIQATSAYVEYSSSNYDLRLFDNRFCTTDVIKRKVTKANLFSENESGSFILNYVTDNAKIGMSGYSRLTQEESLNLSNQLGSTEFSEWLESATKQFQGAYDSIRSCIMIPFNLGATTSGTIKLGGYDTGIACRIPQKTTTYTTSLSIPWEYSDFRNLNNFTSMQIYLPGYGFLELNANDYIGKTSISIVAKLDGMTGDVVYIVDDIQRVNTNVSTPLTVGTVATNALGLSSTALNSTAMGIGALVVGTGLIGASVGIGASLINGIVNSQSRQLGSVGSTGSVVGTLSTLDGVTFGQVALLMLVQSTNVEPSSMVSTVGLLNKKVQVLGTLTGYVETKNASVSASNTIVNNILNNYLNGGIYLE